MVETNITGWKQWNKAEWKRNGMKFVAKAAGGTGKQQTKQKRLYHINSTSVS